MIQDRVRRTLGGSRAGHRWGIHPPILFAVLLFGVWLKADGPFLAWTSDFLWGGVYVLKRGTGDLRLRDLEALRWGAAGLYFLVCAVGAFLEARPVRLDPVSWRPLVLGGALLVCAAATLVPMTGRPEVSEDDFLAMAEARFNGARSTECYRFALDEGFPGAVAFCRERLASPDPIPRARAAAVLYEFGERDSEVRRALRASLDEAIAKLERLADDTRSDATDVALLWFRLDEVRTIIEGEGAAPNPGMSDFRFFGKDPPPVDALCEWWRGNRDRYAGAAE